MTAAHCRLGPGADLIPATANTKLHLQSGLVDHHHHVDHHHPHHGHHGNHSDHNLPNSSVSPAAPDFSDLLVPLV